MSIKKPLKSLLICGASLMLIASLAPANNLTSSASRIHHDRISRKARRSYYSMGKQAFNQAKRKYQSIKSSLRQCMINGLNTPRVTTFRLSEAIYRLTTIITVQK